MTPLDVLTAAFVGLGACIGGALPGLWWQRRRRRALNAQALVIDGHLNVIGWAASKRLAETQRINGPREGVCEVLDELAGRLDHDVYVRRRNYRDAGGTSEWPLFGARR